MFSSFFRLREFRYSKLSTFISMLGVVPIIITLLLSRRLELHTSIPMFAGSFGIWVLSDWLAVKHARWHLRKKVAKDWEFAMKVALDNPGLLDWCKEQNPEFAQKYLEKLEREKMQDMLVERTAQEVREEWKRKRQNSAKENAPMG